MMQRLPDGWQECQVEEVLVLLLNLVGIQGKQRMENTESYVVHHGCYDDQHRLCPTPRRSRKGVRSWSPVSGSRRRLTI